MQMVHADSKPMDQQLRTQAVAITQDSAEPGPVLALRAPLHSSLLCCMCSCCCCVTWPKQICSAAT